MYKLSAIAFLYILYLNVLLLRQGKRESPKTFNYDGFILQRKKDLTNKKASETNDKWLVEFSAKFNGGTSQSANISKLCANELTHASASTIHSS